MDEQPSVWQNILAEGVVECGICPHRCRLKEGQRGRCWVRRNSGGQIEAQNGNRVSSMALDPVEKKPLFHFLPGTRTLSIGTIGCNLSCSFCQNYAISQPKDMSGLQAEAGPEQVVAAAIRAGCPSVSFTYNEPIVTFEQTVSTAAVVRARGLKTILVTAGFIEPGPRAELFGLMDAANVDIKSFSDEFYRRRCGARLEPVLGTLRYLRKETKVWLEVTTLLIPGLNDSTEEISALSRWIFQELGSEIPVHFSAFYPTYHLLDVPPTPPSRILEASEIARKAGLKYVYGGNIADTSSSCTRCASCGATLIEREGFWMAGNRLKQGRCPSCGTACAGVWA